jgi:hypothetical protein
MGKFFLARRYASGTAAMAKREVAAIEVQIVSQILLVTSLSFAVSNKLWGLVLRNIPSNGETMNRRISDPRRINTSCMG